MVATALLNQIAIILPMLSADAQRFLYVQTVKPA